MASMSENKVRFKYGRRSDYLHPQNLGLMAVMNRRADFYHLGCETTRSEIDDLHATVAYEECHRTDDERSERM